jgi:protein TonB
MRDTPSKNLKLQYKRVLEFGLVVSLSFHVILLQVYKKAVVRATQKAIVLETIELTEIPQTEQEKQAPAPARPTVPIASEDEDLPDDLTIDLTDLDLDADVPPPPPPPEEDIFAFIPHDEPPIPVGGFQAIQDRIVYPEIARKAGVEGRVLVYAKINVDGRVAKTKVVKSLGPNGCDEAAVRAIQSVKWIPAKQRDRPVQVWVSVPVDFRLK